MAEDRRTKVCVPCERRGVHSTGMLFCHSCLEILCLACVDNHKIYVTGEHTIKHVGNGDDKNLNGDEHLCDTHQLPLEFTCHEHRRLCCQRCVSDHHETCKSSKLQDVPLDTINCSSKILNEKLTNFWD
ncbi:hypothetical protein DPMN_081146 [Dreissena polymorpha]|uniref:B box-type domain-containing protein n=1 Tax=Dreissena polymorpha TaxID=45954 RepID=A0A9D3Y6V2_DREPO|nr:hypothetical protein DPMN_081146 [Dreissena polymorpha]